MKKYITVILIAKDGFRKTIISPKTDVIYIPNLPNISEVSLDENSLTQLVSNIRRRDF